jgi:hypothetical protein
MKQSSKIKTIVLAFIALLVLIPASWFTYTRFIIDQYAISPDWVTITYKDAVYLPEYKPYASDAEAQDDLAYTTSHIGKTIGVAVFPKRSFSDLIWPVWVMEYDGDKAHDHIFVRGLMDVGTVYVRAA